MMLTKTRVLLAVAMLGVMLPAPGGVALAQFQPPRQTSVGGGRALDGNLDRTSGGINNARGGDGFRSRNLIVTNNVIGGRGFRGTVGYTADDAFRGATGSDDLYQFRADSAWTGLNMINFGSTYQQFRFGQTASIFEYQRVGQRPAGLPLGGDVFDRSGSLTVSMGLDRLSSLSSITSRQAIAFEPQILGSIVDQEGKGLVVRASPITGLQRTPIVQVGQLIGLSTYDFARIAEDVRSGVESEGSGIGAPFENPYTDLVNPPKNRIDSAPADRRVEPSRIGERSGAEGEATAEDEEPVIGPAAHRVTGDEELRRIQEAVASRFAGIEDAEVVEAIRPGELTPEMLEEVEEDLLALRRRLAGIGLGPDAGNGGAGGTEDEGRRPGELRVGPAGIPAAAEIPLTEEEQREADDALPEATVFDPGKLRRYGLMLRHGQRVERLSGDNEDRFNELMVLGEEALKRGRYFWAERRFNRALRFTPGHPLATAGLGHTQIGAGLYLSASLTLRSLFIYQPEMIDVRFDDSLLPNRPRLLDAIATLEDRMDRLRDRSSSGFLYAYIGRLLDEPQTIKHGLDVMGEDAADDPLLPLLREIWLEKP